MHEAQHRAASAATWLFVPGDRPERFGKAAESGAEVVVLDLEDAVAPDRKDWAREQVTAYLRADPRACIRVNGAGTRWHEADLAAVADASVVMVPKAADPDVLDRVRARLRPGAALVALVESAAGIVGADAVAAHPGVVRLAFGSHDLAAELGVSPTSAAALLHARSRLVLASAAAGLSPPVDGVTVAVHDPSALADDVRAAVELGFSGKLCIHPAQVAAVRAGFLPSEDDVAWARRVVDAGRAASDAAVLVGGEMVDRPVVLRAERILAATAAGHDGRSDSSPPPTRDERR